MASQSQLIAKALKADTKSEGMRQLLESGMSVSEVAEAFDAPYGFVYGVATRAGLVTSTPRTPKAKAATKTKAPAKAQATAKAARPARSAAKASTRTAAKSRRTAKA